MPMKGELTGRKVLAITLASFGVVVAVNLTLAFLAVSSFPGLETPNSYIASQRFDAERDAQNALGWTVSPEYGDGILTITVRDATGRPAHVASLTAIVGRPTHVRDDVTAQFTYSGGVFRTPLALSPGIWNIHVAATAEDGTAFRQRFDHYYVAGGEG